ncbi:DUF6046 domain-containing protein [Chryseobacterium indologenes]|uniref:DUF6046 domain-containing protein n=1 Tax=Chryseobacterium indologenes TaxID=253 RepID=UPI001D0D552A|nr:DUF6046 domain-containing protein [Chryseobacterium indologenes]UDQ54992.1 DUF6046 domain-containing protein [Chryseobacterium indologenes]
MSYSFDIKELVARAHFDYIGPPFPNWWQKNKEKYNTPSLNGSVSGIQLGQKYFLTLKVMDKEGNEYIFPNEPLISISLTKTIVETATVGKERRGTVKEYICTEDFQISIKGVCMYPENLDEYPTEQVKELQKMVEINDSLEVSDNPFFEMFGIRNIVIKDIQWDEMAGEQGLQKYSITAVSDQDFYADLKEKDQTNKLNSL